MVPHHVYTNGRQGSEGSVEKFRVQLSQNVAVRSIKYCEVMLEPLTCRKISLSDNV